MVTAFNNNESEEEISIPVWRCAVLNGSVFKTVFDSTDVENNEFYVAENGSIDIRLKKRCGVVLYYGNQDTL